MSENNTTNEQAEKPTKTKKSNQPSDKKIQEISDLILEFINSCTAYELDAIRIIAKYATDETKPETINDTDAAFIVKYINTGIDTTKDKTVSQVIAARRRKLKELLTKAERFCKKVELVRIIDAATDIAIDTESVAKIVDAINKNAFTN